MLNCTKNISDEISHLAIGFDQAAHTVRRSAADQTVFARRVARPRAETARDEKWKEKKKIPDGSTSIGKLGLKV